jgi:hypothetical protein
MTVPLSGLDCPISPLGGTLGPAQKSWIGEEALDMIRRVAFRLGLIVTSLALATAVVVGAMFLLVSFNPPATPLPKLDHVAPVVRLGEAPADPEQSSDAIPTPAIGLVFAGLVVLAALPPVHRLHGSYRYSPRSDWL